MYAMSFSSPSANIFCGGGNHNGRIGWVNRLIRVHPERKAGAHGVRREWQRNTIINFVALGKRSRRRAVMVSDDDELSHAGKARTDGELDVLPSTWGQVRHECVSA